jgi:hypothetical protein
MKVLSDCSGYNFVNVDDMVLLSRFQLHSQLIISSTKAFVSPQFKSVGTSACSYKPTTDVFSTFPRNTSFSCICSLKGMFNSNKSEGHSSSLEQGK